MSTATIDPGVQRTMRQLAVAAFASALSMRLCDPMLPLLAQEFGRSVTEMAGVVTAFAIAYGLFSLVHGPIADRRGKLQVIAWATLIAALGSIACLAASGPTLLIVFRFLTGAVCAAIIPIALAWIGDSVDFSIRQQTLARFAAATTGGLIAGQVIGGLFADTLGWRAAFLVPTAMFLPAGLMIRRAARRSGVVSPVGRGRGFLGGYVDLFRNPWARFLNLAAGFEGAFAFGTLAFIPSYLHQRFEVPLWQAGLIVAAYGVGGLLFAWRARHLLGALGTLRMPIGGGLLLGAGFIGTALAPNWMLVGLACMAAGFGFNLLHNTLQTQATQAHPSARGTAIAGFALSLFVGQSIGVSASALLIERIGYPAGFALLGALLAVLGIVVSRALAARRE
ncbi:MAG: MFS transporter [Burkholderiaceae bacterium]|nr:MFS transporter [Burkholderiaceae bacterium]